VEGWTEPQIRQTTIVQKGSAAARSSSTQPRERAPDPRPKKKKRATMQAPKAKTTEKVVALSYAGTSGENAAERKKRSIGGKNLLFPRRGKAGGDFGWKRGRSI